MSTSLLYRTAVGYDISMRLLYGRHYSARYRTVAQLVPDGASVVDVCCGPGVLYRKYLAPRGIRYTGIDINERYIRSIVMAGGQGEVADVATLERLPAGDVVVMQASLYHFLPDPRPILEKMVVAAARSVVIAEPIRNLTQHPNRVISSVASRLSNAGFGAEELRFTEERLDDLFEPYRTQLRQAFKIPGEREKVYVFDK
jgi:SAM-dependent methyltransferase